jgi:hypothetical protein
MANAIKPGSPDGSRPTEGSLDDLVREPTDIAEQAQRDDPNNYTPGNPTKSDAPGKSRSAA